MTEFKHFSVVMDWAGAYGGDPEHRDGWTGFGVNRSGYGFPWWYSADKYPTHRDALNAVVAAVFAQRPAPEEGPYVVRVRGVTDEDDDPDIGADHRIYFIEIRNKRGDLSVDTSVPEHRGRFLWQIAPGKMPEWAVALLAHPRNKEIREREQEERRRR